jgi:hypothetical protein
LEPFIFKWNRLNAGISRPGKEREATRCRPPLASRDVAQGAKEQVHTIAVWRGIPKSHRQIRLGCLFRPGGVEILARHSYRGAVLSLPERKIHSIKLLPFKDERL